MSESPISENRLRLSVVVPVRDGAPWIGELLDSLLAQGIDSMEVMVVDNGSTDGTTTLVAALAEADDRVRVLTSEATSAAAARNEGAAAAAGEFLVFADADDIVPDGAYRAMLTSLESTGSDLVIGDHLKFSSTSTWSPTARWWPFDAAVSRTTAVATPEVLTGRACWNRMFRRSFWMNTGLRFPEIPNIDDIRPMTEAVVRASSIDLIPDAVYLYRERASGTSLSTQASEATTVRYLTEEVACAELVRRMPELAAKHAEVVFDADGWVHVSRYLQSLPDVGVVSPTVRSAVRALIDSLPADRLASAAPQRRALWELLRVDAWDIAKQFSRTVPGGLPLERLDAWIGAARVLSAADVIADGLITTLVNVGEDISADELVQRLPVIRAALGVATADGEIRAGMLRVIADGDAEAIRAVSLFRRVAPLVVDAVVADRTVVRLTGPATTTALGGSHLVFRSTSDVSRPVVQDGDRWTATLSVDDLSTPGRSSVVVRVPVGRSTIDLPVVTARMPLPPLDADHLLQPLADRRDGWRFLIDRRAEPSRGIGRILRAAKVRLGRS